ncbi:MAG: AbgT family transporter, partial [Bryobacteraceae bacterium]
MPAVAAVFSVNILIKPLDGILTEITNDAIHLINPNISIGLAANFWFSIASVLLLTVVVSLITDKFVEPRLGQYTGEEHAAEGEGASPEESRGLKFAIWGIIGIGREGRISKTGRRSP